MTERERETGQGECARKSQEIDGEVVVNGRYILGVGPAKPSFMMSLNFASLSSAYCAPTFFTTCEGNTEQGRRCFEGGG